MTTSTSALPALNVASPDPRTHAERFNAVIKNLYNKILPVGAASTVLTSDGTTFSWAALPAGAITNTGAQTFLAADVALNVTATTFDGPNTGSIGAAGQVWKISAKASVVDTGAAAGFVLKLSDGTTIYDSGTTTTANANFEHVVPLAAVVTLAGAATFKITARDITNTTGKLLTTGASGTANKATWIMAERLS